MMGELASSGKERSLGREAAEDRRAVSVRSVD